MTHGAIRVNPAVPRPANLRVCVIDPAPLRKLPTFIRAHVEGLPADVTLVHGDPPHLGDRPLRSQSLAARAWRKASRIALRRPWGGDHTEALLRAFDEVRPDVVLSEWGPCSVRAMAACRRAGLPQVAHFHGYDASVHHVIASHHRQYQALFDAAAAVVAVSRAMARRLIELGAPADKVHYNPYGVDCRRFRDADPRHAPPTFIGVGRLVDKKAPRTTIRAFAAVRRACPEAQLLLIGDGPLRADCQRLIASLGLAGAVTLTGNLDHTEVQRRMRTARAFVQHSVEGPDGDCEGTPNAVLEAGATGLPTVATRHAGIPDVVVEGETGLLVDEHDEAAMAAAMTRLARDADLAGRLGGAARRRVEAEFAQPRRLAALADLCRQAAGFCTQHPREAA